MGEPEFVARRPRPSETKSAYGERLQADGQEEMFIRKGVAHHFGMRTEEMGDFFEDFPEARLRRVQLLANMHPNRTEYSLIMKVSRDLGILRQSAERWVRAYSESKAKT